MDPAQARADRPNADTALWPAPQVSPGRKELVEGQDCNWGICAGPAPALVGLTGPRSPREAVGQGTLWSVPWSPLGSRKLSISPPGQSKRQPTDNNLIFGENRAELRRPAPVPGRTNNGTHSTARTRIHGYKPLGYTEYILTGTHAPGSNLRPRQLIRASQPSQSLFTHTHRTLQPKPTRPITASLLRAGFSCPCSLMRSPAI